MAEDLESARLRAQRGLDRVGDGRLVARLALDVDERGGQFDGVGGQVEVGAHSLTVVSPSPRRRRRR